MNRETPSGFPPHELEVKPGAIMMLCKNVSTLVGLCNGTRVQVMDFKGNTGIVCRYLNGPRKDQTFDLFRCEFEHGGGKKGENEAAFAWKRTQFPLRPGFVITVNKAQGERLNCF